MKQRNIEDHLSVFALARAACLTLGEDEYKMLARELDKELAALSALDNVETEEQWQDRAVELGTLRADGVGACLPRERLLAAAHDRRDGCFAVLGVLDSGEA